MSSSPLTAADRVQVELWRRASPGRRSEIAGRLSSDIRRMAMRGIRDAYPELDDWQVRLKFVEIHHGPGLAARLEADLTRRGLVSARR